MRVLRRPLPERGVLRLLDRNWPQTPNGGPEELRIRRTDRLLLPSELRRFGAPRRSQIQCRAWGLRGACKQRRHGPPRRPGEVRSSDCARTSHLRELPISRVVLTRLVGSGGAVATSAVPVHTLRMNVGSVRFVCALPAQAPF